MSDKPDLSDLKARLGLTKSSVATTAPPKAGGPASGPPGGAPRGPAPRSAPGQAAMAPAPRAPAQQGFQPPPAQQPQAPPAAQQFQQPVQQTFEQPPAQQAFQPSPAPKPVRARKSQKSAPRQVSSMMASDSLDSSSMDKGISGKMIGGAIVAMIIGAVFGFATASVMNNRQLVEMRRADAELVQKKMKAKVASFNKASALIKNMSEKKVDYDLATKLKAIDFKLDQGVFASNRLLLGGVAISKITQFMADSASLSALIRDHERATTKVDKDEIQKLLKNNQVIKKKLGVLYDYVAAAKNSEKEGYNNKAGQLAEFVKKSTENKKKYIVRVIGASEDVEVDSRRFIRIKGRDVLRVSGKNALSRYEYRVKSMKYKASQIEKYAAGIDAALAKISETGDTPVVAFSKEAQ